MMLINDEVQADVYKKDIAPNLTEGKALAFAHGFNIRYKQIVPPAGCGRVHGRPQGPRPHRPLHRMSAARACPAWWPWSRTPPATPTRSPWPTSPASAAPAPACMETTFHDETETDLFGEQTVLCGGVVDLMQLRLRDAGGGRL